MSDHDNLNGGRLSSRIALGMAVFLLAIGGMEIPVSNAQPTKTLKIDMRKERIRTERKAQRPYAKAPYEYENSDTWATEGLPLSHNGVGPDIAVGEDGTLVLREIRTSLIYVLRPGAGSAIRLQPMPMSAVYLSAAEPVNGKAGLIPPASAEHRLSACGIAVQDNIIHVLYCTVENKIAYRSLLRFDYAGHPLGGWSHECRWTERATRYDCLALDKKGNIYVASQTGFIVKYNEEGQILQRWKVLTPEMKTYWLKTDIPPLEEEDKRMRLAPERFEMWHTSEKTRLKDELEEMEEQIRNGEPEFVIVDAPQCPYVISGLAIDEEEDIYITGTGLQGILKITPSGKTPIFKISLLVPTGGFSHPYMRDLAYRNGKLVAGSDMGPFFAFDADGVCLGALYGARGYSGSGDSPQVTIGPDGSVYVLCRTGRESNSPWPDRFIPLQEEEEESTQ